MRTALSGTNRWAIRFVAMRAVSPFKQTPSQLITASLGGIVECFWAYIKPAGQAWFVSLISIVSAIFSLLFQV
jgi:hypothetical protein